MEQLEGKGRPVGEYPIEECPDCGNDEFYVKQRVSGVIRYNYRLDGIMDTYNSEYIDHLKHTTISKYAYCNNCNKRLFKITEVMNV